MSTSITNTQTNNNNDQSVNKEKILITNIISQLESQLGNIFKSNVMNHDFTLLNGFLTFTTSKLANFLDSNLQTIKLRSADASDSQEIQFAFDNIMTLLTVSWEKLWNPIFRWFQQWHQSLVAVTDPKKIKYPEFRRLNSHLNKYNEVVTNIFVKIIKNFLMNFDTSEIISYEAILKPLTAIKELNPEIRKQLDSSNKIQEKENDTTEDTGEKNERKLHLNSDFKILSPGVLLVFHRCILYLGCTHKYKTVMMRTNPNNFLTDFKTSLQLIESAITLLPSIGETFFQRALIELQCNHIGLVVYDLLRGSLASMPNGQALNYYQSLMFNLENPLNKKLKNMIASLYMETIGNTDKLVNREIIESFPLALIGSKVNPSVWVDPNNKMNLYGNPVSLKQLEMMFFDKVATRYMKNLEMILKNLLVLFGSFHLQVIQWERTANIRNIDLVTLRKHDLSLLKFIFKYVGFVIEKVVLDRWDKDLDSYEYLGMIRIIVLWIQTNKFALEYSQSDPLFNQNLALLLNSIIQSRITKNVLFKDDNILIKRNYIFKEEVMLRDFTCITIPKFVGIDDEDVYSGSDKIDKCYGILPKGDKPTVKSENYIRLESIVILGKQFMKFNKCGVTLNNETGQYIIPAGLVQKANIKTAPKKIFHFDKNKPKGGILHLGKKTKNNKNQVTSKTLDNNEDDSLLSFDEIEAKLRENQKRQCAEWGYSGSSVVAPSNINVKPSFDMMTLDKPADESRIDIPTQFSATDNAIKDNENTSPDISKDNHDFMEQSFKKLSVNEPKIIKSNTTFDTHSVSNKMPTNYNAPPGLGPYSNMMPLNNNINSTSNLMNIPMADLGLNGNIPSGSQDLFFGNLSQPMTNLSAPMQYPMQTSMMFPSFSGYEYQKQPQMQPQQPFGYMGPQLQSQFWNNNSNINNENLGGHSDNIQQNMSSQNQYMNPGYPSYSPSAS